MRKVKAMDFNPSSQWLACVTADFSIVLIPVYFLLAHARPNADSSFGGSNLGGSVSSSSSSSSSSSAAAANAAEPPFDLDELWATSHTSWFNLHLDPKSRGATQVGF